MNTDVGPYSVINKSEERCAITHNAMCLISLLLLLFVPAMAHLVTLPMPIGP